jgi:hypothetical protein
LVHKHSVGLKANAIALSVLKLQVRWSAQGLLESDSLMSGYLATFPKVQQLREEFEFFKFVIKRKEPG